MFVFVWTLDNGYEMTRVDLASILDGGTGVFILFFVFCKGGNRGFGQSDSVKNSTPLRRATSFYPTLSQTNL